MGAIQPCAYQYHAVDSVKDSKVWREKPRTGESIVLVLKPQCFPESADAVGRGGRRRIAHGQSSIGLEHEVFRGPGKTRAKRLHVQDAPMAVIHQVLMEELPVAVEIHMHQIGEPAVFYVQRS